MKAVEQRARAKRLASLINEHRDFQKRLRTITNELRARREANEDVWGIAIKGTGTGTGARVAAALATGKDES